MVNVRQNVWSEAGVVSGHDEVHPQRLGASRPPQHVGGTRSRAGMMEFEAEFHAYLPEGRNTVGLVIGSPCSSRRRMDSQ